MIEKIGVCYVPYHDQGHGLVRPANNQDFMGRVEKVLAEHLSGRRQPIEGEKVPG